MRVKVKERKLLLVALIISPSWVLHYALPSKWPISHFMRNNNKTSSKFNLFNNHNHSCLCKCQCPKIILDSKISKLTLQLDCQMNKHNPTHCLPFNSNRMQTKWLLVFRMLLNFNRCRMKIQPSQHSRTIPKWLSTTERKVTMFLQSNTTWRWRKSTQKMALHGRRLVTVTCFPTT